MRSALFVPGDSEKKFIKAMSAAGIARPDGLILDLEDSVAASEKPKARQMTASFIAAAGNEQGRSHRRLPQAFLDADWGFFFIRPCRLHSATISPR